jgi:conjugative relaxase-like TrwC/TraI family protein
VRFAITALGSAGGRSVGQVVNAIVRYLEPRTSSRPSMTGSVPGVPSGEGPASYYSDRGTEPGRWLGITARESGLTGAVESGDFARVLAGRDPRTGGRLVSASGSAGRRPALGVGQHTTVGTSGELIYSETDAAAALGVEARDLDALLRSGQRLAIAALAGATASGTVPVDPPGSYLVPLVASDESRWVTGSELDRCQQARAVGTDPGLVAAGGEPGDQLSISDAARLAGVTQRYLRRLARRWETDGDEIQATLDAEQVPERAYLVAHRGTRRQWIVTRGELVAFLERRVAPAVRVGFDLTLTTEKSLGVLGLLGDTQTRAAVLDAIQAGNDLGLEHLEYHATAGRHRGSQVLGRGLTVASFRHLTSRALDPFPHHHNVVANTIVDEHGTRRALDARLLYTHAQAASALATIEMRHHLRSTLAVEWRRGRSGSWEIDGISDEVLRTFSQRRTEIEDTIAELEAEIGRRTTLDEVHAVITGTRAPKQEVDPADLVEGWWARARLLGLTPDTLRRCVDRDLSGVPAVVDDDVFVRLADPEIGVCAGHSLFTRSDVLAALADMDHHGQPLPIDAAQAERLADGFLASDLVVQLDTTGLPGALGRNELYTTREILDVQRRIQDCYRAGLRTGHAVVADEHLQAALGTPSELSDEQRNLVRSFCQSGHSVQCAVGRAGAGKTTAMAAAATAWHAAGYEVLGAAVKGEAARHLANGADIPTETVAWYLARADRPPLHSRSVLVIDEASTLSDRDLDALLEIAGRTGATVRLIGDPDQHGAVAAGGMYRHLCTHHPDHTPELATTRRVQHAGDRIAADLLRSGQTHKALAHLADAGHLHVADDDLDLYLGMLTNWWDAHRNGAGHPMVDRRHHTRRVLNRLARQLRRAHGELGDIDHTTSDGRAFAVGDHVVARMAARHLHAPHDPDAYVRNGATGTITDLHACSDGATSAIEVCFDGIGSITLPHGFLEEHVGPGGRVDVGIDHAYALTSYAVQGATFEISTSRIDEGATRSETYVDITRGRQANHLYLTRAPDPLDGEHLPKAPEPKLHRSVADRLERSGPERVAIELPEADRSAATARLLAHAPPPAWSSRHVCRPNDPVHLRRHHDAALAAVLAYRTRWHPGDLPSDGWGWALGQPPTEPDAATDHAAAVEALDQYAFTLATHELGIDAPDDWAVENLRYALSVGVSRGDLRPLVMICHELADPQPLAAGEGRDVEPIGSVLRRLPFAEWIPSNRPADRTPATAPPDMERGLR